MLFFGIGIVLLVAGGFVSLALQMRPKAASMAGSLGAVGGCALALTDAVLVLLHNQPV